MTHVVRMWVAVAAEALLCGGCAIGPTLSGSERVSLPLPDAEPDRVYLGLTPSATALTLEDISCDVLIVELFDMYCHLCQKGAPGAHALHTLIRDRGLDGRIKVIGIGAGNTPLEVQTFRKKLNVPFPTFPDRERDASNALGLVRTPEFIGLRRQPDGTLTEFYRHTGYFTDAEVILSRILKKAHLDE